MLLVCASFNRRNPAAVTTYYVSAEGVDSASGTSPAESWKSISKLTSMISSMNDGDSVLFRRGDTFMITVPIKVIKGVHFAAYGSGPRPVITGLKALTFVQADTNLWYSNEKINVPFLKEVTLNDKNIQMGRWPNPGNGRTGYHTIDAATPNTITQNTSESSGQPPIYPGCEIFYRPERFWIESGTVTDYSSNVISFNKADDLQLDPKPGWGYFIQNDSAALDIDYEWWLNTTTQRLKIFKTGDAPTGIRAAVVNTFFAITNIKNASINEIEMDGCNSDAIQITGTSAGTVVSHCTIHNVGRNGIFNNARNTSIDYNTIKDVSSKGIIIYASSDHFSITNDTIRDIGQLIGNNNGSREEGRPNHSGDGVYVVKNGFGTISYNIIQNCGYAGVHFKAFDSIQVNYNYIDSFCNVLDDGGGIYSYSGDKKLNSGRTIIGNTVIHGIGAPGGRKGSTVPGSGVAAIYLDEYSSQIDCYGNYCSGCEKGIFINYGNNNNRIRSNTLVNNIRGIQINTRNPDTTKQLIITNNLCYAYGTGQNTLYLYADSSESLLRLFGTIDSNHYYAPVYKTAHMMYQIGNKKDSTTLTNLRKRFLLYDVNSDERPFNFRTATESTNFLDLSNNTQKLYGLPALDYVHKDYSGKLERRSKQGINFLPADQPQRRNFLK